MMVRRNDLDCFQGLAVLHESVLSVNFHFLDIKITKAMILFEKLKASSRVREEWEVNPPPAPLAQRRDRA
jgi:hypothetical protein